MVQELLDPTMPNHPPRYVLNDNHTRTMQSAVEHRAGLPRHRHQVRELPQPFSENDEWPQARAVAFAGYLRRQGLELVRCEQHDAASSSQTHFMFDLPGAPTSSPADPNERLKRVAQLITDPTNPRFAKTIVNRLWKRYMGLGLFEPADDYREDTPPSHPELLDWLADDFIRARLRREAHDPADPDQPHVSASATTRRWRTVRRREAEGPALSSARPALRRLTAEQMLDSIAVAMEPERCRRDRALPGRQVHAAHALARQDPRRATKSARSARTTPPSCRRCELLNGNGVARPHLQGRPRADAVRPAQGARADRAGVLGGVEPRAQRAGNRRGCEVPLVRAAASDDEAGRAGVGRRCSCPAGRKA